MGGMTHRETLMAATKLRIALATDDKRELLEHFGATGPPSDPILSFVTPVFNGMPYLPALLQSISLVEILDYEHVVADGGSTDGTQECLRGAVGVRGVSRKDRGLYDALNWAIDHARGKYIQWANADDIIDPSFVRNAVKILEARTDVDLVIGQTMFIDEQGMPLFHWHYDPSKVLDLDSHARGYFFNINSAVFRREKLLALGAFNQDLFPLGADIDMQFRMCLENHRCVVLNQTAYRFRIHGTSLTGSPTARLRTLKEDAAVCAYWGAHEKLSAQLQHILRVAGLRNQAKLGWRLLKAGNVSQGCRTMSKLFQERPWEGIEALASVIQRDLLKGDNLFGPHRQT